MSPGYRMKWTIWKKKYSNRQTPYAVNLMQITALQHHLKLDCNHRREQQSLFPTLRKLSDCD